jgi:hypothetical protein
MNHIKVGEIYRCEKHRAGLSNATSGQKWELFTILDEKKRNEITVFANNLPNKGSDGCSIKILSITEVKNGPKKSRKDDKWYQTVTINADVDVIESDINFDGDDPFAATPLDIGAEDFDDDIPWKDLPM